MGTNDRMTGISGEFKRKDCSQMIAPIIHTVSAGQMTCRRPPDKFFSGRKMTKAGRMESLGNSRGKPQSHVYQRVD